MLLKIKGERTISVFHDVNTSLVVIGAWNQAILNAEWLNKNVEFLSKTDDAETQINLFPLRFRTKIGNVIIHPSQESLVITPKEPNPDILGDIQTIGEQIWDKLPQTPVTKIGHNFAFKLDDNENYPCEEPPFLKHIQDRLPVELSSKLIKDSFIYSTDYVMKFNGEDYELTVRYKNDTDDVRKIQFNFEYDLKGKDTEKILKSLKEFLSNYKISQHLISSLIVKG